MGYNASDSRLAAGTGTVDARTRTLAAYLAWNGAASYLDLVLTRAWTRFEYRRELDLSLGQGPNPLVIDQTFLGEADGRQRGITLSAGYELTRGGLSFGPYLRGSWVRQRIDGFVERALFQRAGTALALRVEAQRLESRQLTAGARVQYAVSTSYGVLLPHAQLEYVREYEDDPLAVVIALVHDPSAQRFVLPGDPQDRSFANLGLGVSATLAGGRSGFLYYERALGLNGQRREQLALGLRFEF
ncbi:MAG: autotransporter outer membrane beta-barrel domain-containing protein [Xanthomonadales bacterium]|nr:autotransporter outer membrane beta-barrel domain-containing protein [Xanthomonadales bacterium]